MNAVEKLVAISLIIILCWGVFCLGIYVGFLSTVNYLSYFLQSENITVVENCIKWCK